MNIDIQANGIPADKDVLHFITCRAELALGAMHDQLGLVGVVIDGTGDGNEIRCRVLIRPRMQTDIVVEGSDANLYVAIHRALDDAGWTLAASLLRQQSEFMHRQFKLIEDRVAQSATSGIAA